MNPAATLSPAHIEQAVTRILAEVDASTEWMSIVCRSVDSVTTDWELRQPGRLTNASIMTLVAAWLISADKADNSTGRTRELHAASCLEASILIKQRYLAYRDDDMRDLAGRIAVEEGEHV